MQRLSQLMLIAAVTAFLLISFMATGGRDDSLFIETALEAPGP